MNIMASRAGKLYRDITWAELCMEEAVARLGIPYRIQFPYYLWGVRFFPDFLLPTLKVIIEVDDASHNEQRKKEADEQRTLELNSLGWTVVRCTNDEAIADAWGCLNRLLRQCKRDPRRPLCSLSDGLPKKVAKQGKMSRGALRTIRQSRAGQKDSLAPPPQIPREKSSAPQALN